MNFNPLFDEITKESQKNSVYVNGIAESVDSFLIYDIYKNKKNDLCAVLTQDQKSAERICEELNSLENDCAKLFPQAQNVPYNMRSVFGPIRERRLIVLNEILDGKAKIVVMPISTIFEPIAAAQDLFNSTITLVVNEEIAPGLLAQKLTNAGFTRESSVNSPGQYSKRGGIFDIYAFGSENPIRLEFWGDTIDSIREFDIFKQRSIKPISQITILPMREFSPSVEKRDEALLKIKKYCEENRIDKKNYEFIAHSWSVFNEIDGLEWFYKWFDRKETNIFEYFPKNTLVIQNGPPDFDRCYEREIANYESHKSRVPEIVAPFISQPEELLISSEILKKYDNFKTCFVNAQNKKDYNNYSFDFMNQHSFNGDFALFLKDLYHKREMGFEIVIFAENHGFANRLKEMLEEQNVEAPTIEVNAIKNGFFSLKKKIFVYNESKIFDRNFSKKYAQKMAKRAASINYDSLSRGDIVVHVDHGIGKYIGVDKVKIGEFEQDCLFIEYRDKAMLQVPIIDYYKIQKYIGKDGLSPELSQLGSPSWARKKERTRQQLQEMALKMAKLYAKREFSEGLVFGADGKWQNEFEDLFEFEPTIDQIGAIEQVKKDLEDKKPMDRLVCGDVGFGKTEVAMRAAFKAAMSGFQTAVLAPTTILASQHAQTFKARMAQFPVRIEELSRLVEDAKSNEIKQKLKDGKIDILIGTHKILSKDVNFKNLGLLIIDEEQRFGVSQKDLFTNFRHSINVLSMSATPIPRTLHMSMAGIRDLSLINTAPQNRLSIETRVAESHDDLIKSALENELERGGQAFVVLNRIEGLNELYLRIEKLVPNAKIAMAHGQMEGEKIDKTMGKFIAGQYDILICTTIIENGIDIPNANTIIVENSDKLGLSQLYQLRGRVGRSNLQAFAYFLVKSFKTVKDDSMKRLKALEQYTDLGSGFQLAMRDLELRGAGNLLGTDQSGSISAVGFELYCQLLKEEIERLKNIENQTEQTVEPKIRIKLHGYFPSDYVSDTSLQIMLYQKCTSAKTIDELNDFQNEIVDRFGAIPEPVVELLLFIGIKILARNLSVKELVCEDENLTLTICGSDENVQKICSRFMKIENAEFIIDYGKEIKLKTKISQNEPVLQAKMTMGLLAKAKDFD
ncbi:MAG: transcription-repair coupling factor [Chitinispirillales bacterium]|jgi:transcription-repair coupling factor (superfamily II helicase)|nr:transcription-repair coupling factor [Chitinispirillales bacterium]